MKYLVLIFTLLIIASCTSKEQKQTEEIEFDWLIGDWVRVGDDQFYNDTITTFEYWNRIDNIYLGKGIHKIKRKAEQMACDETLKMLSI